MMEMECIGRSSLCGALRRAGGELGQVMDVEGRFVPENGGHGGDRLYGRLETHDASVRVGFDAKRIRLPGQGEGAMLVSGKLWLDEQCGVVTLMVRFYRYLEQGRVE